MGVPWGVTIWNMDSGECGSAESTLHGIVMVRTTQAIYAAPRGGPPGTEAGVTAVPVKTLVMPR